MLRTLLLVIGTFVIASTSFAQVFPLDAFGISAEWGRPAFIEDEWVSILSASTGSYLVEGDTARFLSPDRLDRVLYDGDRVVVLNDGDNQFLPSPSNVGQLSSDRRSIESEFTPTIGGQNLSMLDVVISETTVIPVYLTSASIQESLETYEVATYFHDGYFGNIGRLRGLPSIYLGEPQASSGIGVGVKGDMSVFISRIPMQDKSLQNGTTSYAYGVQVVDVSTGTSVDRYTELRGEPIGLVALNSGYALVTNVDVLFLNDQGEELGVVLLPEGYTPISACANEQADGVCLLSDLAFGARVQTLLEIDALGVILNQYRTVRNQMVLTGIFKSSLAGFRIQGSLVGVPFWREGNALSDFQILDQVSSPFSNLRYDDYPYVDTIGRKMIFSAQELHHDDTTYLKSVKYTSNGNVVVDYGSQRELRSPSGQYMGEPSDSVMLDTAFLSLPLQGRLTVSSNNVLWKVDASSGRLIRLLTASSGSEFSNPLALPGGLVIVAQDEDSHIVVDTFGNLQTTLSGQYLKAYAFEKGLVLAGSGLVTSTGLLLGRIDGYSIYPYKFLKKPLAISGPLVRCNNIENITYYDEIIGADRTIFYGYNTTSIFINGVRFLLDVVNQVIPSQAIQGFEVQRPCEGGSGSVEVNLTNPGSIDSVLIAGQLANPLVFSGSAFHDIRLVDTAGCVADTFVSIAEHRFPIRNFPSCFRDANGFFQVGGADSVFLDGIYSERGFFESLSPGDYSLEIIEYSIGCAVDTTITILEVDSIEILVRTLPIGDSIKVQVEPLNRNIFHQYSWQPSQSFSSNNSYTALSGDTVFLTTRVSQNFTACFRYDTVYTQAIVNTSSPAGNTINVYPNPTTSQLTIEARSSVKARLVDAYGRFIAEWQVPIGSSTYSIAEYPAGAYTLLVGSDRSALPIRIIKIE